MKNSQLLTVLSLVTAAITHAAPTIPNPSFETGAAFTVFPGYISDNGPIPGWTSTTPGRVGIATGAPSFADNGAIPAGSRVAFIQSGGGISTLSTTLTGLTVGTLYHVKFSANARSNLTMPTGSYRMNGAAPVTFFVRPVGGTNAYNTISDVFRATATTARLEIANTAPANSTLLLDAFSIEAAAPILVTNTNDAGNGSLRWALATAAASTTTFNAITFAPGLNGETIRLSSELAVNDASGLAIDASSLSSGLTIDGGTGNNRIFLVTGAATRVFLRRLTLTSGDVTSGASGGAIASDTSSVSLEACSLAGNSSSASGGAIFNSAGILRCYGCTFSSNQANFGGAIYSDSDLAYQSTTLVRCTFNNNIAISSGGAIRNNDGRSYLSHCTIFGNAAPSGEGAGVASYGDNVTETVVDRCIITGNANSADVDLVTSSSNNSFTSGGRNIIGVGDGTADFNVNDLTGQNAQLTALADNGGPTQTMMLGSSSPAKNYAIGSASTVDQRGRPLNADADAGALELQPGVFSIAQPTYRVVEGAVAEVMIQRREDVSAPATLRLNTRPGTATAADFTPRGASETVSFPANSSSEIVYIHTTADSIPEGDHSFTVELANTGDGAEPLAAPTRSTVIIADPIIVTTTSDDGPGSLRQAIRTAAQLSGPDTIVFKSTLSGQRIIFGSEISVEDADGVTVDATSLLRGLTLDGGPGSNRLFFVGDTVDTPFTLRGLSLTGGNGTGTTDSARNGQGGAILMDDGFVTLTLERCTLFGNTAAAVGGAIFGGDTTRMIQCTLSGNTAGNQGGALYAVDLGVLVHCTVSGNTSNSGGGITSFNGLTLERSIISGNTATNTANSSDVAASSGIVVEGTSFVPLLVGTVSPGSGSISGTTVPLGPLADNGGPTLTHALLPDSPARDAGTGSTITTDQRGVSIVVTPDVGAYEVTRGGVFTFNQTGYVGFEGGSVAITVTRSGGSKDFSSVTLTATAGTAGTADYTWITAPVNFDDNEISRTVTIPLTASDGAEANEFFTLKLTPASGGATLGTPATAKVYIVDESASNDTTLPSPPKILIPAANGTVGVDVGGQVTISGTAMDDRGVRYVEIYQTSGGYITTVEVDTPGAKTSTWFAKITPVTGFNAFQFATLDARPSSANHSNLITHSFRVTRPLLISVSGSGSVTRGYAPKSFREVGSPHTITAIPGPGFIFNGWSIASTHTAAELGVSASALSLPTLTFIHREGLILAANFTANPFTPGIAGSYNGVMRPNSGGATLDTVGDATFNVQSSGAFTGTLRMAGGTLRISGLFDANGKARFGSQRNPLLTLLRPNKPGVVLSLTLEVTQADVDIEGELSVLDQSVRTASIRAVRCPFSAQTPVPAFLLAPDGKDGIYTGLVAPGSNPGYSADQFPQGFGFFTQKISRVGRVTVSGRLADDTPFTTTTLLDQFGQWHLFTPLYGGKGLLSSIQSFEPDTNFDFDGDDEIWLRPVQDTQHYPGGWPEGIEVFIGSAKYYVTPGTSVLSGLPSNGEATVNIGTGSFGATLSPADIATASSGTLKINRSTGLFTGTFQGLPYQGIILNKDLSNTSPCGGYFMTPTPKVKDYTGQGGSVVLTR